MSSDFPEVGAFLQVRNKWNPQWMSETPGILKMPGF